MANVAQPQTKLRVRPASLPLPRPHPLVGGEAANLLAEDGADDEADVLEADLLGVEAELFGEDLWHLEGCHYAAPEEDHGVGDGGEADKDAECESEGGDEGSGIQGRGVDAVEAEELADAGVLMEWFCVGDVAGFRAEEHI